ncbi:MAG: glutathione S-transferase family protein [Hyphomonas sp.]
MREVTAYDWVPDFARGLVRDVRVRWALEEAGLAYRPEVIDHQQKEHPDYLARQPFAQVPAYRDGEVNMFESGAIVMHIAEGSEALMPADTAGRARVLSWAFAAMNSVEPFIMNVVGTELFCGGEPWAPGYLAYARQGLAQRLGRLSAVLEGQDYLVGGRFTAADLLMASVLREPAGGGALNQFPALAAYRGRCTARPAFRRALEAQLEDLSAPAPAGFDL